MSRIINTAVTKIIISCIGLLILLINSNQLGANGVGTLGIITLTITIILMVNELVVGGALVYLVPRYQPFQILVPAYLWSFVNAFLFYFILKYTALISSIYQIDVILLALILSLSNTHAIYLLGKKQIKAYNAVVLIQYIMQLVVLIFMFYVLGRIQINSFIVSLYFGYAVAFLTGLFITLRLIKNFSFKHVFEAVPALFGMGLVAQISNTAQLLNYRLSYFLIERFWGTFWLGRYVVSMQLSESVWIISRSVALVQYADIANASERKKDIERTLRYVKFIFFLSLVALICIVTIPSKVYSFVLGKDFEGIQSLVLLLAPGIISLACSHPLTAFFSGTGNIRYNMYGSLVGLVVTLTAGIILIPRWGVGGAALTQSLSYAVSLAFVLAVFIKKNNLKISSFVISSDDFREMSKQIRLVIERVRLKRSKC